MVKKTAPIYLALVCLCTSILCVGLYHWDNKYTHSGTQAINGLFLWDGDAMTYLTREWLYYPNALLTPQSLGDYRGYRQYVTIGTSPATDQPYGTYRMVLSLPDEPQSYTLALPEIFSACRVYVGEHLLLQLGDPDPQTYTPGVSTQLVTFSAQGTTEILIAVASQDSLYQGMTYPPAFGLSDDVLPVYLVAMLLHGATVVVCLLGAMLFLIFGVKVNPYRGIWGAILCISTACVTSYPLVHSVLTTTMSTWHSLNILSYFTLLLAAIYLLADFCALPVKQATYLALPCWCMLLCACLWLSPILSWHGVMQGFFQVATPWVKLFMCALLLWISLRKEVHLLPACGAVAFATGLFWDWIYPLYEPIYSVWFGELGGILLVFCLWWALWSDAMVAYRFHLSYSHTLKAILARYDMQKKHYQELSEQIAKSRQATHDMRHHMRMLRSLAEQGELEKITAYLNQYGPSLEKSHLQIWSENPVADAIVSHYAAVTRGLGGTYDVRLSMPPDMAFPDEELCVMLSNLLENATEALQRQETGVRKLYLRGEVRQGRLCLFMENSFDGTVHRRGDLFLSRKHQGLGIGLQSIATIAENHGGLTDFSPTATDFQSSILIPLS